MKHKTSEGVKCNKCKEISVLRSKEKTEYDNICGNGVCTGQEIQTKRGEK